MSDTPEPPLTINVAAASASSPPGYLIASPKGVNKNPENYTDEELDFINGE